MNDREPDRRRRIHRLPPKDDVERELRFHLAQREAELIAAGWDVKAARAEAQRLFGNYGAIRGECSEIAMRNVRAERRWRMWSELRQDLRYAVRGLMKAPAFALLAITTLALGIGANSAAFAIVYGVLLAPLPYPEPDRLVALWEVSRRGSDEAVTYPNFADLRRESRTLSALAAYQNPWPTTVLGGADAVRAPMATVSADLFDVLGVRPERGRLFSPEERVPGGRAAVVVSHEFWRDYLGSPTDLAAVTLNAGDERAHVIGVMPANFDFPRGTDIWFPLDQIPPSELGTRTAHNFRAVARLAPDATIERARLELKGIIERIRATESPMTAHSMSVYDLREDSVGDSRRALMILLGASAFVLLVACTNLASALLGRTAHRRHEFAVRASLGARRMRLVRQLLTESVVLAALGAIAGIALAAALIQVITTTGTNAMPRLQDVRLDGWVIAFTTLVAIATALVFGTVPALRGTRADPYAAVREGGRGTGTASQRRRWSMLVGTEVALALLLLVGSGLLIRSFQRLTSVDPGFVVDEQLTVQVSLPESKYGTGGERTQYHDRLLETVRAVPGVEQAALTISLPLADGESHGTFDIEGGEVGDGNAAYRVVSDDFFEVMGTPIVSGRGISRSDRAGAQDVVVVNERLANEVFPDGNAIGKRLRTVGMDSRGMDYATIVGVVGDVRTRALDVQPMPGYYLAYPQRTGGLLNTTLIVRGSVRAEALTGPVRDAIHSIDRDVVTEIATLDARIGATLSDRRFMVLILAGFASVALVLSAVGIYAVVSAAVAERTREIGIRVALGAATGSVLWSISRGTIASVGVGVLAGFAAAVWLSRLLAAFLYETAPFDSLTFVAVALVLLATVCAAMLVPAVRALAVSPVTALRADD